MANVLTPGTNAINRQYNYGHEGKQVNPWEGVPEHFAHNVYKAPGDLVRLLESLGEYSMGQRSTRPASRYVDDKVHLNAMNFNPADYGGLESVKAIAGGAGSFVGDPFNAFPFLAAYVKGVKALAKANPMVENLVNKAISPYRKDMTVWHGSPHRFDKFSADYVGTGEGAQAYGHGAAYLAEAKDVGTGYRKQLTTSGIDMLDAKTGEYIPQNLTTEGIPGNPGAKRYSPKSEALVLVEEHGLSEARAQAVTRYTGDYQSNVLKQIEGLKGADLRKNGGYLYKVDLPDEKIAQMLDWDKPLSEQPQAVKDAAAEFNIKTTPSGLKEARGSDIYHAISRAMEKPPFNNTSRNPGSVEGSAYLQDAGIPGIKYLDGNSRAAGNGTRNFVVFDGNDATILERNGEKVLPMDASRIDKWAKDIKHKKLGAFFVDGAPDMTGTRGYTSKTRVLKNPTESELIREAGRDFDEYRIMIDTNGDLYAWDAKNAIHGQITNALDINPSLLGEFSDVPIKPKEIYPHLRRSVQEIKNDGENIFDYYEGGLNILGIHK